MNQESGIRNAKTHIALASLFCIIMGAVLGALPSFAHAQATGGRVFITPVVINNDTDAGGTGWLTAFIGAFIPSTATGVILEAEGATRQFDERILIREDSASSYNYVLLHGRATAGGDAVAWANQGVFPVSSINTFQYSVTGSGFDGGWEIRLIGYTTATVFIDPIEIGNNGNTSLEWKTYANAGEIIPPGATGVILEAEAAMSGPDYNDMDMHIKIRKNALSPQYVLLRGRAAGNGNGGDEIGWANQGTFPVSSGGTFDYRVEPPGGSWKIRLIGYTTTTNVFIAPTEIESYVIGSYSVSGYNEGTITTSGWITFNASNIIHGATGVILEAEAAMDSPDNNDVDAHIRIREDSASPYNYVLLRGRCAGDGDKCAWANQGVFPISSTGTFDYAVESPGFRHGWEIRIIGYVPGGDPPPICSSFGLERTTTYDLQNEAYAFGYGVAVDSSNNTYVTGEQYAPATGLDMYVNKYAANGTLAWSRVYDDPGSDESGYGIAVTQDGSAVYAVGSRQNDQFPDGRAFIRKYDSAGSLVTSFGSGGTVLYDLGKTSARAVALDSAGNVYVAGHRGKTAGSGIDALLLSYTPFGAPRSGFPVIPNIATAYNSSALGIAVQGSNVYFTGYIQMSSTDTDMFVEKRTTSGTQLWNNIYQSNTLLVPENDTETGYGVSVDSSGNVFVTGYTSANGGHTFLRKYNPTGTVAWGEVRNFSGVPNDVGMGAVVGNSGRIFVTGRQQTNNEDAFLAEYYTDQTKITAYPDASSDTISLCADDKIGFVYERQGSEARVYLAGFSAADVLGSGCGDDPGKWLESNGKKLFYKFDWDNIPPEINEFTAIVDTNDYNINKETIYNVSTTNYKDWKGSATFTRSDNDKTVIGGPYLGADNIVSANCQIQTGFGYTCTAYPGQPCDQEVIFGPYVCYPPASFISTVILDFRMDIRWHSALSGLADSVIRLYQGDKGGMTEYNEIAYGIAQTNSTTPGHTTTSNDIYVVGYQASGGGSAFLNKYSCSATAAVATGESAIATFTATPASGVSPLTVHTDARASAGTITKYEWDWNYSGNPLTFSASASLGALASNEYTAGEYMIALRITTNGGATSIATQAITVSPNQAPVAGFTVCGMNNSNCVTSEPPPSTPSAFTGVAPLRVNVDGEASDDPNETPCGSGTTCLVSDVVCPANGFCPEGGYIASFSWDWGDGTTPGVGEKATHQYFTPGSYTITLTVTDNGGLTNIVSETKDISVVAQYVCTSGSGSGGSCAGATPACGPTETPGVTACYACLTDATCGIGYQCLGAPCKQGDMCLPDAFGNAVACPVDGKCPEFVTCNPLSSATCPDGSGCPASGICAPAKNVCALSGSGVATQCYVEEQGSCVLNADCTESVTGGVCESGSCRYARCSNETELACVTDNDCADSDGICDNGACVYIYDCAYGPGMGGGVTGLYSASTPDTMPKMPLGIQPDGQACTQPTPDAPNNCEGINGCLYYNYYLGGKCNIAAGQCANNTAFSCSTDKECGGIPIPDSNNSVANCVNTFEGGTGCMYYQYYSPLAVDGVTPTTKTNCLPRYAEKLKKSPQAGIPEGCFVVDKGASGKEYNCTSIDGCYYYLDGSVDCTYVNIVSKSCIADAECAGNGGTCNTTTGMCVCADAASCTAEPLAVPVCNTGTGFCEYQGNGCKYEPNPKGAISCPGAVNPATGGDNFVQCTLNPDGLLPGFLNTSTSALNSCSTNADCPVGNICINGTCFPACQTNIDCATGEQCTTTCATSMDCTAGLICDANVCVLPKCAGATPSGTLWNVTMAYLGLTTSTDSNCGYSTDSAATFGAMTTFATTDTTTHSQQLTGLLDGSYAYYVLCQELSSSVLANMCQIDFTIDTLMCVPGTICPNGAVCPASGICPSTVPACAGAFPKGKLPFGTTSTDIGLTTKEDASCHYSLVAIDPYTMMPSFTTTSATSHSTNVVGLLTGANTYYAKCQDVAANEDMCSIAFTVGDDCTSSLQCFGGFMCIGGICQPPVCENAAPTGALAPGTTSATISMTTPADANCRYSINSGDAYSAMAPFATTGGVSHSSFVSGLVTGGNTHYVRCQDAITSAEKFCSIPFSVGVCNQQYKCETGWMCIPNIGNGICVLPPICTPGTLCPDGQMCPANGICPPQPPCVPGDLLCPILSYCPQGSTYNATTGSCDYGNYDTFCSLNPTHPLCVSGPSGPNGAILSGITSCNTLGYTFTGTAITPSGNCDLVAIILALLSWMAWIIALLAVLSGLRAAYLYITSMDDERKLILARRYLIYTTIGVAVSVLSFSVVAITRAILNI